MSAADKALVISEFENAIYPSGAPTLEDAWVGIYQVLLWYSVPSLPELQALMPPHGLLQVHDLPELWVNAKWREEAVRREAEIAAALQIPVRDVPPLLDRMMRLPRWAGKQRNNPLGNGFRTLVAHIFRTWGSPEYEFLEEQDATRWFPGVTMPGRSAKPFIDVLGVRRADQRPVAVISCKWGIRHDRISDPTNECVSYRTAMTQQSRQDEFRYYVVTSESYGQRLDKVMEQPCITGLVHTHLPSVRGGLTQLMSASRTLGVGRKVHDLAELVAETHRWP